jgi:hypothetical protein
MSKKFVYQVGNNKKVICYCFVVETQFMCLRHIPPQLSPFDETEKVQ